MVAEEGRGHLDAPVACDAVKVVLIALVASTDGPPKPQAGLYGAVGDEVVALFFKPFFYRGGEVLHDAGPEGGEGLYSYSRGS